MLDLEALLPPAPTRPDWSNGLLSATPDTVTSHAPATSELPAGVHQIGPAGARSHLLVVPDELPDGPVPLVVLLHGASSDPAHVLPILQQEAEDAGIVILAPKSTGPTWDAVRTGFGPDIELLDTLLDETFEHLPIDPQRIAIAGFSDGATAALSIGLANGELFSSILAFSPGFVVGSQRFGEPAVFVSHGTADSVLPIDRASRRIVPQLERVGYEPEYVEFDGYHEVPADVAARALARV
ncbi:alpha/beta hydrolase [Plantibacter sp. Mn2098]|uniref:alpha/beta hydrolase n=1 Tax=Plantibacter sp. Mn2098 TaxID=3395266 RepID=UPI003BD79477